MVHVNFSKFVFVYLEEGGSYVSGSSKWLLRKCDVRLTALSRGAPSVEFLFGCLFVSAPCSWGGRLRSLFAFVLCYGYRCFRNPKSPSPKDHQVNTRFFRVRREVLVYGVDEWYRPFIWPEFKGGRKIGTVASGT